MPTACPPDARASDGGASRPGDAPRRDRHGATDGFTLIEMLVSLSVLGVMTAMVAPTFNGPLETNRVRAMSGEFVSTLGNARTEAARRGVPVTLCPRAASTNTCAASASNWNNGWILYADLDASGGYDGTDVLIAVRTGLPTGSSVGEGQAAPVSVLPSGEHVFSSGSARTIAFKSNSARSYVVVSRVGRAAVLSSADCGSKTQCEP